MAGSLAVEAARLRVVLARHGYANVHDSDVPARVVGQQGQHLPALPGYSVVVSVAANQTTAFSEMTLVWFAGGQETGSSVLDWTNGASVTVVAGQTLSTFATYGLDGTPNEVENSVVPLAGSLPAGVTSCQVASYS